MWNLIAFKYVYGVFLMDLKLQDSIVFYNGST